MCENRLSTVVWIIILLNIGMIALNRPGNAQTPLPPGNSKVTPKYSQLYFSVVDENFEIVNGLTKEELRLKIGGRTTAVTNISLVSGPVSVGFLFDVSDSNRAFIDKGRKAAIAMIQAGDPKNKYFALAVHNRVEMLTKFSDGESMRELVSASEYFSRSHGSFTAFYDAVSSALGEFRYAKYKRQFLVIFSDGEDTRSKMSRSTLREEILRSNVVMYGMDLKEGSPHFSDTYLSMFCWETGGILFRPSSYLSNPLYLRMFFQRIKRFTERRREVLGFNDFLEYLFESTMWSMNNQYVLGFDPGEKFGEKGNQKVSLSLRPSKETNRNHRRIGLRYRNQFFAADPGLVSTSN